VGTEALPGRGLVTGKDGIAGGEGIGSLAMGSLLLGLELFGLLHQGVPLLL
jgi:hypothetical protein